MNGAIYMSGTKPSAVKLREVLDVSAFACEEGTKRLADLMDGRVPDKDMGKDPALMAFKAVVALARNYTLCGVNRMDLPRPITPSLRRMLLNEQFKIEDNTISW